MHMNRANQLERKLKNSDQMLTHAQSALKIIEEILGQEQFNYHRAKALSIVGKCYLALTKNEDAEKTMLEAQSIITSVYGERSPLAIRYNLFLLETYNRRPEGPERS